MRTLLLTLTTCLFILPAHARYGGGSGTADEPYQIATAADLILLGETPEDYDKHFVLTADIDLAPHLPGRKVFDKAVIAPDTDPAESSVQGPPFTGVFDGHGHRISHLTLWGESWLGLFGQLGSWARVIDLGLVDVNIAGSGECIGGLAAYSWGGDLTRCYTTGAVHGGANVGGLVGANVGESTVTNSYSSAAVTGSGNLGGLVGWNSGTVICCYSAGAVRGSGGTVGGLIGYDLLGCVDRCFWDTQASGQVTSAGGTGKVMAQMKDVRTYLEAGWDWLGEIENGACQVWQMPEKTGYPVLAIFAGYTPPQLVGLGTPDAPYLISDALELGAVYYYSPFAHYQLAASIDLSNIRWAMAVVPWFAGTFNGGGSVISHLNIVGGDYLGLFGQLVCGAQVKDLGVTDVQIAGSGRRVGGLAGVNWHGVVARCYSTGTIYARSDTGGLVGSNYDAVTGCHSTASVSGGGSAGGLMGANGGNVSWCYSAGAVSGTGGSVGGLVGNNRGGTVIHCYNTGVVTGGGDVGGLVGTGFEGDLAQCYNTGLVSGTNNVGGLVGDNSGGTVARCCNTGRVSGNSKVGGLLGSNLYGGGLTQCYNTGEVSGDWTEVGGLAGSTYEGLMAHCYNTGIVRGRYRVGGLVGENKSSNVTRCYSAGTVSGDSGVGGLVGENQDSPVVHCFWDVETSGQSSSGGGTGLPSEDMYKASTFLDAGWDFVGETANGTEDIWWILEGQGYPRLSWELEDATP